MFTATFAQLAACMPDDDAAFWAVEIDADYRLGLAWDTQRNYAPHLIRDLMIQSPLDILTALGEAGPKVYIVWEELGLRIDQEAQTVIFTARAIIDAYTLVRRVQHDYDQVPNSGVWEELELGGDDDVDYWGGYLQSFLDLCVGYAATQGETITTPDNH